MQEVVGYLPGGRLSGIDLTSNAHNFVEMDRLLKKHVAIPSARSPGFKEYGDDHINLLAEHFSAPYYVSTIRQDLL